MSDDSAAAGNERMEAVNRAIFHLASGQVYLAESMKALIAGKSPMADVMKRMAVFSIQDALVSLEHVE